MKLTFKYMIEVVSSDKLLEDGTTHTGLRDWYVVFTVEEFQALQQSNHYFVINLFSFCSENFGNAVTKSGEYKFRMKPWVDMNMMVSLLNHVGVEKSE